ncbi:MAG: DUF1667 domain-containing protein [Spirochaetaceae bacterium]|nr:DUF1667 domain-containing protein [Spirochaetaceae bacterium]
MSAEVVTYSFPCASCPRSCPLEVRVCAGIVAVSGNACAAGTAYGRDEALESRRVVTTTVRTVFADRSRLPVKTTAGAPKDMQIAVSRALSAVLVDRRARIGEVVARDILGLGIDAVATDDMFEGGDDGRY